MELICLGSTNTLASVNSAIKKIQPFTPCSEAKHSFINPNLGEGGEFYPPLPPCWFSLCNSETVKAATLAFCNILLHVIKDVCAKFGIPYLPQSPDIGQNSDEGISDFRISGQSLIKRNCQNSWTSNDIGMKLGPETKLDKKNKTTSKNLTMTSCRKIVTSLSFFRYATNLEQPGSRILDA